MEPKKVLIYGYEISLYVPNFIHLIAGNIYNIVIVNKRTARIVASTCKKPLMIIPRFYPAFFRLTNLILAHSIAKEINDHLTLYFMGL